MEAWQLRTKHVETLEQKWAKYVFFRIKGHDASLKNSQTLMISAKRHCISSSYCLASAREKI